jgi:hypothetical protein
MPKCALNALACLIVKLARRAHLWVMHDQHSAALLLHSGILLAIGQTQLQRAFFLP